MSDIELIKSKIDLVDFIGKYTPLKKAGINYKGLCPFHQEKTPSFVISAEKQIWHCFGCGKGGDVFRFLMEREGIEFPEAIKILADQTGVQLSKQPSQGQDSKKRLYAVNEMAAKYFEKCVTDTPGGRKAKDYLVNRGILLATIQEFRLGYAPDSGRALVDFLQRKEFTLDEIEKAGLGVRRGKFLEDKFVHRVMFPLFDALGRVVGFTGRVLADKAVPKYLNSPETAVFHKSELLYGLHLAKPNIQQSSRVVLVEGQMDTISSYQAGVKNVVGVSGTALTAEQMKIISRYATDIVLSLDADSAGSEATKRAVELASEFELGVKVALLGNHKDPDSVIKSDPAAWAKMVENAVSVMDFYFETALARYNLEEVADKKQFVRDLLLVINRISDPVEKDHYLKRVARLANVDAKILYDVLGRAKQNRPTRVGGAAQSRVTVSPTWAEERALVLALTHNELLPDFMRQAGGIKWASGLAKTVYTEMADWYTAGEVLDISSLLIRLPDHIKTSVLEHMLVVEQDYNGMPADKLASELAFYLNIVQSQSRMTRRKELAQAIETAQSAQDKDKLMALLAELKEL